MASISWTLYPCRLSLFLDLLRQVVAVAIGAVTMFADHSVTLQVWVIFKAYFTGKAGHETSLRVFRATWSQACSLERFVGTIHVSFYKPFFVPS